MAGKPGARPVPFATVLKMREERAQGAKLRELAERYGVTESAVSRICTGDAHSREGGPRTRKREAPANRYFGAAERPQPEGGAQ